MHKSDHRFRIDASSFAVLPVIQDTSCESKPEYVADMLARAARFRCVPLMILLAAAVGCPAQPIQSAESLSMDGLGKGIIPLAGPWKFQIGDDPRWASPFFDDSGWETISGERPWGQQGHPGYTGYAWYRIRLTEPSGAEPESRLSLLVPHIHDVYEIFWNGELIGHEGRMPSWPLWRVSQSPRTFELGQKEAGELVFRVWKAPLFSDDPGELGGFDVAPAIGSAEGILAAKANIEYEWLHRRQLHFSEQLIYGLIALLSFLVWWCDRGQRVLLWMTGYALSPLIVGLLLDAHLALPYPVAMGLTQPANCLHDVSLWFLLLWLLHLSENRALFRSVKILAIASLAITSVDGLLLAMAWHPAWLAPVQALDAAITSVTTLTEILPLVLVAVAIRQKNLLEPATWIVVAVTILDGMFFGVQEAVKQGRRFTGWTIGDKLAQPLFSINGNDVKPATILGALLLVAIVAAVFVSYREERQTEMLLAHEFNSARELQRMLIPEDQHSVPGYAVSSSYRPALEVGGDFFQLIPVNTDPNGSSIILLGDVSGHGLKAALTVSFVMGITRVLAELHPEPGPLLTEMNQRLCGQLENAFVTCIAVRIDRLGTCTLSSAGHPPPFLNWRSLEVPGALPLGLDVTARYDQKTLQFDLGDHLALYTDGLLEARNKSGELYGFERLQKLFAANPTASEAAEEAVRFGQDDDVTVVTLAYQGILEQALEENVVRPEAIRY